MTSGPHCERALAIGVDFGTLSARAVVARVLDGEVLGVGESQYQHGVMDTTLTGTGVRLGHGWALQVPSDHRAALVAAVRGALDDAEVDPSDVVGIGTDFTACTVLPVRADGTPLCELPEFAERPHAYVKLWKHHAAQAQADRLNQLAHERAEAWIGRYGGRLSSEWQLAKGLQILEEDPELYAAMDLLVESADWIVWQLCGTFVRNRCTVGFKGAFQNGAYPDRSYFAAAHPSFASFADDKLCGPIGELGDRAGDLTPDMAERLGLPPGIAVCVGNVDAHVTVPAAGAAESGHLVAIMGTSTCHVMIGEVPASVDGMCGAVDGGIVPDAWAYEAGQSGVGDIFGWVVEQCAPRAPDESAAAVHERLTREAAAQPVGAHGLVALDWWSGNRSVLVDHDLTGLLVGLTLRTTAADLYRAVVESTAFGARTIIEALESGGIEVDQLTVAGGLIRNPLVMQIYADILRRAIHVVPDPNAPALGSAMHAAVAAGAHPDIRSASAAMARVERDAWLPDPVRAEAYDRIYSLYRELHDRFGRTPDLMHGLRRLVMEATA